MIIYKIYAVTKLGEMEKISPMACNTNREEMLKISKRLKYEMSDFYKKVELRADTYAYQSSEFIEV